MADTNEIHGEPASGGRPMTDLRDRLAAPEPRISLHELIAIVLDGKWLILGIAAVVFAE